LDKVLEAIDAEIEEAEKSLEHAEREYRAMGCYEDCGPFYEGLRDEAEMKLKDLVHIRKLVENLKHGGSMVEKNTLQY
jgi:hypothetical protein